MKMVRIFQWGLISIALFSYMVGHAVHVMNPGESRAVFKRMEQKLKQPNAVITQQEINTLNAAEKVLGRSFAKQYAMLTDQIEDHQEEQKRAKELKEKKEKPFKDKTNLLEMKEREKEKEAEEQKVEEQIWFKGLIENQEEEEQKQQEKKENEQKKAQAQEDQKKKDILNKKELEEAQKYGENITKAVIETMKDQFEYTVVGFCEYILDKNVSVGGWLNSDNKKLSEWLKGYTYNGKSYTFIADKDYKKLLSIDFIKKLGNYIEELSGEEAIAFEKTTFALVEKTTQSLVAPTDKRFKTGWSHLWDGIKKELQHKVKSAGEALLQSTHNNN